MTSPDSPLASPLPWDLAAADYATEIVPYFEHDSREAPLVLLGHRMGEAWAPMRARLRERVLSSLGEGPVSYEMKAWLTVARR